MTLEFVKIDGFAKKLELPKNVTSEIVVSDEIAVKQESLTGRVTASGNPHLGPDLKVLGPNLGPNFIWRFQLHQAAILCAISRKTNDAN